MKKITDKQVIKFANYLFGKDKKELKQHLENFKKFVLKQK